MLKMRIDEHKPDFTKEKQRILIGFLLLLTACLLLFLKVWLTNSEKDDDLRLKTTALYATKYKPQ